MKPFLFSILGIFLIIQSLSGTPYQREEEENDYVLSSPFFLSGRFVNVNDNDNNLGDGNNDNIDYGPNRQNQKVSYGVVGSGWGR